MAYKFQLGAFKLAADASIDMTAAGASVSLPSGAVDAASEIKLGLRSKLTFDITDDTDDGDNDGNIDFQVNNKYFRITVDNSNTKNANFVSGNGTGSGTPWLATVGRGHGDITAANLILDAIKDIVEDPNHGLQNKSGVGPWLATITGSAQNKQLVVEYNGLPGTARSGTDFTITATGGANIQVVKTDGLSIIGKYENGGPVISDAATFKTDLGLGNAVSTNVANVFTAASQTFSSADSAAPVIHVTNSHNDANSSELRFVKDGDAGTDNDKMGKISFYGTDAGNNAVEELAYIEGVVKEADHGNETGKLSFFVSSNAAASKREGLKIEGNKAADLVDVTIGYGSASTVTIPGNLTVNGSTTTINTATLNVEDDLITISLGNDTLANANGSGIEIECTDGGTSNIEWKYNNGSTAWLSNVDVDVASSKVYKINGVQRLADAALTIATGGTIGAGNDADMLTLLQGASITVQSGIDLIVADGRLVLGSTAVTAEAAELNLLDTAVAGTIVNNKAVIYGANGIIKAKQMILPVLTQGNGTLAVAYATHHMIVCDATSGNVICNLPDVSAADVGKKFIFKRSDSSANSVTINKAGDNTIDGVASVTLDSQFASITCIASADNTWSII